MSSQDEPAAVWPDIEPGGKETHYVDFTAKLTRYHQRSTDYALNTVVQPDPPNGFEYKATAGRTGTKTFIWPTTVGGTVTDGGVTWTCQAVTTASLVATVSGTPTWTVSSALAVTAESISGQIASALIDAASATDGTDEDVVVTATLSDGQIIVKRVILPIREAQRLCSA